ncbi:hypothetical protein O3M35_003049 [Rhynocoris fuscipes]|uniref:Uncharacterized protein n=1 Tax=Rhynocoris fuscipes TaxID=488301 RepID=A0AAW1CIS9_9HEMI
MFWDSNSGLYKVFRMQKMALRIVLGQNANATFRGLFKSHNILTVPSIYIYNCLLFYKNNPSLFERYINPTSYNTRGRNNLMFPVDKLSSYAQNGYTMSVKLFNKLPLKIKQLKISEFKRTINNFLMKNSFYNVNEYLENNWRDRQFALD